MKNIYRLVNLFVSGLIMYLVPTIANARMENSNAEGGFYSVQYSFICISLILIAVFIFVTVNLIINNIDKK